MKPIKTPLAGAIALALAAMLPAVADATWTTRTDLEVTQSRLFYDRAQGAYYVEARLVNRGGNALTGPLRIIVERATLSILGADGEDGGQAYFEVEPAGDGLAPGASTGFVRIAMQRAGRGYPSLTLRGEIDDTPYALQLLHASDIDSTAATLALQNVKGFSAFLNHFRGDATYPNTVTLSSGDNWIPGPRYSAAADDSLAALLGVPGNGRGDVAMLNAMGFQASTLGNHELDQGTAAFVADIGAATDAGSTWAGARFPYVSTNLDFSTDASTAPFVVANGQDAASIPHGLAGWATIDVNGQIIGVVGATTPALGNITSPGGIGIAPASFDDTDSADLDALAAEIQPAVDALTARGINKVILLAHMQQIAIEKALAPRLRDVDIIVAGGSNTLLSDSSDVLRPGDTSLGTYPVELTAADGEPVLVVNTDGDYKYLGRLVSDFSVDGLIDTAGLDTAVNGVYATTADRLAEYGLSTADADPTVTAIANQLLAVVDALDGNTLGLSQVYLDGRRGTVRTEESNLGDLTADANLWLARQTDPSVQVSIKNGGGIRADIGQVSYPPGSTDRSDLTYLPPEHGEVSQLDAQSALAFNNGLTLVTLTAAQLQAVIEHGVAASSLDPANTQGRFPQVAGIRFSWNPSLPAGSRVRSLAVGDDSGAVIDSVVEDGSLVGDPDRTFRVVTLDFMASGGDGYPFPSTDRVDLAKDDTAPRTGLFTFAADGSEQDAFAEYLGTFFAEVGYDRAETDALDDPRSQNLGLEDKTEPSPIRRPVP
ncbi:MAG: 5'-nucleotidase C-terminal domain-containing protein [Thiohalocapsa sp.]|uniref:bifunctional metallophosphatase/5'-nucleotidase n=1 Tax=Thiohalocapsa sp. TaxID=2497641 RepID=UPI0025F08988|nr:5'-nucleotidase C-terminal domain-containing protein [Thiohalocapsa sp.]MCG6941424.1 5'-nucleotidase C-terminal domain-containing protein [Thiohalocapsa sp.]